MFEQRAERDDKLITSDESSVNTSVPSFYSASHKLKPCWSDFEFWANFNISDFWFALKFIDVYADLKRSEI